MFVLRVVAVLVAIAVGACLVAYLFTRERRYLGHAGRIAKYALLFALILLALIFLERVLAPVVGAV